MEMTGEFRIPAPRERVWHGLNDPEILKQAIPGCQTIDKVSDTEFTAKVRAKVGPVSATFGGKVNLTDLDPPKGYTISGEGNGGVAGFAKGSAKVSLDEDGNEATVLRYEVQAHVGGKLAQIGSRLIDATSRKMAEDFFTRFVAAVSPPSEEAGGRRGRAGSRRNRRRESRARRSLPMPHRQRRPRRSPQLNPCPATVRFRRGCRRRCGLPG